MIKSWNVVVGLVLWSTAISITLVGCAPKNSVLPQTYTIEQQNLLSRSNPMLDKKCSRCHDLGRVYAVIGSSGDWVKTVVVMSGKEDGWISDQEMENLATCTFATSEDQTGTEVSRPPESLLPPRVVFEKKCSHCHELGRCYAVIGDTVQWVKTVMVMSDKDREWLSGDTMKAIIRYRQRHPDYVERLFDDSCGACHGWGELRATRKTVSQWRTTVKYMARRCKEGMQDHEQEAIYYALAVP